MAALLTLAGYSINDTVVVFDRIRENRRKYKRMALADLINLSTNQMLTRTILTSVATAISIMPLLIYGGPALFDFSAAILFGIVVGTFSSIYVAAALLLYLPAPVAAAARAWRKRRRRSDVGLRRRGWLPAGTRSSEPGDAFQTRGPEMEPHYEIADDTLRDCTDGGAPASLRVFTEKLHAAMCGDVLALDPWRGFTQSTWVYRAGFGLEWHSDTGWVGAYVYYVHPA